MSYSNCGHGNYLSRCCPQAPNVISFATKCSLICGSRLGTSSGSMLVEEGYLALLSLLSLSGVYTTAACIRFGL